MCPALTLNVQQVSEAEWILPASRRMRVDCRIFASPALLRGFEEGVWTQLRNVASLPGMVAPVCAMPDAHHGYGFPIGGVAASDPEAGGVVSAGGVGFDIACGVRTLTTGLPVAEVRDAHKELVDDLFKAIPAGLGGGGELRLSAKELDAMLRGGAEWAVQRGLGQPSDLDFCEEHGRMAGARPEFVSDTAKQRQAAQVGTLGSGNHYLEVQRIAEIFDPAAAQAFGLVEGEVCVSIHCGSRGLGHQIGTDYLTRMLSEAPAHKLELPDKELACAPLASDLGREYLGAMRAGINCALANRQVLSHLTRQVFAGLFPGARLRLLYDVSHNTCKEETHTVDGRQLRVFVHRKGATRAFPPGHPELPSAYRAVGQPVLVGGSMGTSSYVLAGAPGSMAKSFGSANHGAGRAMSRTGARKRFAGGKVLDQLRQEGILVRAHGLRGVAEEAPGAYKDIAEVVRTVELAGLATPVARLEPLACIKG